MKFTLRARTERRKTNPKDLYFTSYRFPRPVMQIVEAAAIKTGISLNEAITQFIETWAAGKKQPKLSEIKVTRRASKHARDSYTKPAKKVKAKKAVKAKAKSVKKSGKAWKDIRKKGKLTDKQRAATDRKVQGDLKAMAKKPTVKRTAKSKKDKAPTGSKVQDLINELDKGNQPKSEANSHAETAAAPA